MHFGGSEISSPCKLGLRELWPDLTAALAGGGGVHICQGHFKEQVWSRARNLILSKIINTPILQPLCFMQQDHGWINDRWHFLIHYLVRCLLIKEIYLNCQEYVF